ncbi:hypothetical protein DVA86_25450 [Streptomyces armeniacus]|uniref:Uncharacterized protein n=1 Tax=Streptomyces armeniacus TaxID=83291 RepID=A0A345XV33_9ACTN|nr:hypothetical protein [Streptomyces armeniacus]AXK35499.1 hypothetical protein DVA86_25450 [Streptomyces armeniacus]
MYREGTWLIDRRLDKLGRLMATDGPYVLLRPPRGGREWECPPDEVRLAMEAERRAAGIAGDGTVLPRRTTR